MTAKTLWSVAWIVWVCWFIAWEGTALATRRADLTLSDYVWRLEGLGAPWTALRYLVAATCLFLFLHLVFGLLR